MRIVRILLKLTAALVVVLIVALAAAYVIVERRLARTWQVRTPAITVPADAEAIARGKRLVTAVAPCADCHGQDFGGKVMVDDAVMGRLAATNLTRGRGGIAATYTDEDWARAMLHGVRRDGRSVVYMPSNEFRFTAEDVGDIVAFFRSLPPVDRELPPTRVGPMPLVLSLAGAMPLITADAIEHETVRFATPPSSTSAAAQGAYLLDKSGCRGCHQADLSGGGGPPPGATNITPTGIGPWSEADFLKALREHVRPDGSKISETMPATYGQMSDEELRAIFSYLKTVPARGKPRKQA
jgi:mono/diheme cytochrome c family protein